MQSVQSSKMELIGDFIVFAVYSVIDNEIQLVKYKVSPTGDERWAAHAQERKGLTAYWCDAQVMWFYVDNEGAVREEQLPHKKPYHSKNR